MGAQRGDRPSCSPGTANQLTFLLQCVGAQRADRQKLATGAGVENNHGVKLLVLAFAVLGLALELAHLAAFKQAAMHPLAQHGRGLVMVVGFGLPCAIALLDVVKPLTGWPYLIAAACFATVFVHARMWDLITKFADLHHADQLYFAATVGGLFASALASRRA